MIMPEQVSNRRVLYMFLLLGLVLVPAVGIISAVFAPREGRDGKPVSTTTLVTFPAMFIAAGLAFTTYAARRCPVYFEFADALTVRYLFHTQVIERGQIAETSNVARSTTAGGHGTIPLTAEDSVVAVHLADGSKRSWGVSKGTGERFNFVMSRWLQEQPAGQVAT
jgi:hypothetical protein